MTAWQIYFLMKLDVVAGIFIAPAIVSLIVVFVMTVIFFVHWDVDKEKPFSAKFLFLWFVPFFLGIIGTMVPTTKEMAAILIVPKMVNNAKVQEIPEKILTLATEWMEELRPKSKEVEK